MMGTAFPPFANGATDGAPKSELQMREVEKQAGECSAGEIADDGDGRVDPVGFAFAGDGQQPMYEAWTEIARGVDGVAGGSTEREADGPYKTGDEPGCEAGRWAGGRHAVRADGSGDDD